VLIGSSELCVGCASSVGALAGRGEQEPEVVVGKGAEALLNVATTYFPRRRIGLLDWHRVVPELLDEVTTWWCRSRVALWTA
jgi:hypothetical protein